MAAGAESIRCIHRAGGPGGLPDRLPAGQGSRPAEVALVVKSLVRGGGRAGALWIVGKSFNGGGDGRRHPSRFVPEAQADLDQRLIRAAKANDAGAVAELIRAGGNVNAKDAVQDSAFLYAGAEGIPRGSSADLGRRRGRAEHQPLRRNGLDLPQVNMATWILCRFSWPQAFP